MYKKRVGAIIVPPGAIIARHEKLTADYLATRLDWDITFLVPDRRQGMSTADFEAVHHEWETKAPTGRSQRTIENNLRLALEQSAYIVLDLRRMDGRRPTQRYVTEVKKRFKDAKKIKWLIVITREETHIDFRR